MLCKKCGAQIPDDSKKCEFCGEIFEEDVVETPENNDAPNNEPIENEDIDKTKVIDLDLDKAEGNEDKAEDVPKRSTHEIFEENEKKRRQQVEKVVDEKQQQLEEITERRNQKRLKQKRNRIIFITVLCAVVAAAAGAGTYIIKNGGLPSNTIIATPAPSASPIPTLSPIQTAVPSTPNPSPEPTEKTAERSEENNNTTSASSATSSSTTSTTNNTTSNTNTNSNGKNNSNSTSNSSVSSSSNSSSNSSNNVNTTVSSGNASNTTIDTNKYSGTVSGNINSKLVVGNSVVYDAPSNKYFMTFNMDGTMYYANVSAGSTTEQVHGKYITISAEPTNGRYDGNTVYDITSMTYYDGDFILPESGTKKVTVDEIKDFSKDKLGLARNEIYARHGRKFQMEVYQKYFEGKSWYKINPNYDYTDDNNNLNEIELENVSTILSIENSK